MNNNLNYVGVLPRQAFFCSHFVELRRTVKMLAGSPLLRGRVALLFITKSFNRIQPCGAMRWIIAEDNADGGGHAEREGHG